MLDIAYEKLKDFSGQYFIFDLKDDLTTEKVLKIVKRLDKLNLKTCYILTLSENNYKSFVVMLKERKTDYSFYDLQQIRKILTSFALDKYSNKLFIKLLNCTFFDSFL